MLKVMTRQSPEEELRQALMRSAGQVQYVETSKGPFGVVMVVDLDKVMKLVSTYIEREKLKRAIEEWEHVIVFDSEAYYCPDPEAAPMSLTEHGDHINQLKAELEKLEKEG